MSAALAIIDALAAGIHLLLDGDDLALDAAAPPSAFVLEGLSRHKAEIVALLRLGPDGWSSSDWHIAVDTYAGLTMFEEGPPREQAAAVALGVGEHHERGTLDHAHGESCWACQGTKFWKSLYGVIVCVTCHPPSTADVVESWLDCRTKAS